MRRLGGTFLGGATSRLLPMSMPFRYFGAAVVFHLLAWLALLASAAQLPRFATGLGWPLAALHLVTLGVLVMSAIGASLQLLPVATRQPLRWQRAPALMWWLYSAGVIALTLGMGLARPALLGVGAVAVVLALLVWATLLAANLRGARGMPGVVSHGWAALVALLVALTTALSLVALYLGVPLLPRATALALHVTFAVFGFMGLLALGLSYILVPMFALAALPEERWVLTSGLLAVAALALAAAAALGVAPQPLRIAATLLGAAAAALHVQLMRKALRDGMRHELGRSLRLVQIAWGCLLAGLATALAMALAMALELPLARAPTLFGLLVIAGWLLSLLLGMQQRILPFLASMHVAHRGARPPTPSALSADRPLALHFSCHLMALAGLALTIVTDSGTIAAAAAAIGAVGAAAYASFFVILLRRWRGYAPGSPALAGPQA